MVSLTAQPAKAQGEAPFGAHCNDTSSASAGDTLVKNGNDAIAIAFVMWRTLNPELPVTDESVWGRNFTATLDTKTCVWEVAEKPAPSRTYSTFAIGIGAPDGRFLGALISD